MSPSRASDPGTLPGRDRPLAVLQAVLADVRAARRGLVLVHGEAGIGKTTLVRASLEHAGATVLWAGGEESEGQVALGVIDQLIRTSPLGHQDRAALHDSMGPDPLNTGAALVALVDRLELDAANPLVVVVDDAHWADPASLRALAFAARRLRRDPVALVLTARTDSLPQLPEGLRRLVDDEGVTVRLGPLSRDDVRLLASDRMGQPVSANAAERLRAHTGGVPIHLVTLLEELPPDALTADGELPSPRSFNTLVVSRLAGCHPDVEALVTAAAVLGEDTPLAVLAEVAGTAGSLAVLDDGVRRGMLTVSGRGAGGGGPAVAIAHPLIRAAILGDLSHARRSDLHRRAAEVLHGPAGLRHRLLGAIEPDGALWERAMAAAEDESAKGNHSAAAATAQLARGVAPDDQARQRSLLVAVDQQLHAGHLEQATDQRDAVLDSEPTALRRYVEGRLAYVVGPRREARAHFQASWDALVEQAGGEAAIVSLPAAEVALAGAVAAMSAMAAVDRAAGEAGITWARRAIAIAPGQAAVGSTAHMLAGAYALTGQLDEGLVVLDELCAAADPGDGPVVADAHSGRGLLRLWSHDLDGAGADFERSLGVTHASFAARETARFYLADVRYRQGRWDDAVLFAETAASLVDDGEQVWMAAIPHAIAARPLAARGLASGQDHLDRAVAAADLVGGVGRVLTLVSALEVAACANDLDRVLEVGEQLIGKPIDERLVPWRATYVEALAARALLDASAAVLADLEASARTPAVVADLARATAADAAARGDAAGVDRAEALTASLDADVVGPYPQARLDLALGRARRRNGQRRRAIERLARAKDGFDSLDAQAWAERTDREIAACGLQPSRRGDRVGSELTPTERTVAHLVARGLTNREVGAELVISAKTVEHHLSRIYAKVGVRSRTELAAVLRPEG